MSLELTHPVCDVHANVDDQAGLAWRYTVVQTFIPLDDAVQLSHPVWGGPLVLIEQVGTRQTRWSSVIINDYHIVIRAFIMEEAMLALDALMQVWSSDNRLLASNRRLLRFRDDDFTPVESWEWPQLQH